MGLTHIEVTIINPARPDRVASVRCLVDSGAAYSMVPAALLGRLEIQPHSTRTFILADGSPVTRSVGDALFMLQGHRGASPVIFGEPDDSTVLGTVTLEALGFVLDPFRRELRPLPLLL